MWSNLFVLILFTIIFFYVIGINVETTRSHKEGGESYDGNGYYQYKGRGERNENIDILLSRIDWLAKNANNTSFYTVAYLISYAILLAVIFVVYAYSRRLTSPWEMILILFSSYIVTFSILNLFQFHTDKYPQYYIRKNLDYIAKRFGIKLNEPPDPIKHGVPHRTEIQDVLTS